MKLVVLTVGNSFARRAARSQSRFSFCLRARVSCGGYCKFCQFTSLIGEYNFPSSSEILKNSRIKGNYENEGYARRSSGNGAAWRSHRSCANGDSGCTTTACPSGSGWSRARTWLCLGRRIPELEWDQICMGKREVGSSAACWSHLGVSPLGFERGRLGVL